MNQFIKYFRKEPTHDELLKNPDYAFAHKALAKKKDVVIYSNLTDLENGKNEGRWMWYYQSKPNKNVKYHNFGGFRYKIVWLKDL